MPAAAELCLQFQFGGTVTNTFSVGTTYAPGGSTACFPTPVRPVINKQASKTLVTPGETISYTIEFANAGGTTATGARITDVLPAGITFVTATMNGVRITPVVISPPTYVFTATGATTTTLGVIPKGGGGTLVITGTVVNTRTGEITNQAALFTDQTEPVSATATTEVRVPLLTLSKAAAPTLLTPGDTVAYSITLLNSGDYTATNVTVTDVMPIQQSYFTYYAGSANAGGYRNRRHPDLERAHPGRR